MDIEKLYIHLICVKTMKNYSFLKKLFAEFFNKQKIQSGIQFFLESKVYGWEKWFQLEFCKFLDCQESIAEWWIEESLRYDKRMEKAKNTLRPDILIRKKKWAIDTYSAIELKQNIKMADCITAMVKDLDKLYKSKDSELNIRNIISVGIYERTDKKNVKNHVVKRLEISDWDLEDININTFFIPRTDFAYTLIEYDYT